SRPAPARCGRAAVRRSGQGRPGGREGLEGPERRGRRAGPRGSSRGVRCECAHHDHRRTARRREGRSRADRGERVLMAVNFAQWGNDLYTGRRSYDIVGRRKLWFTIAAALVILSGLVLGFKGLEPGIEFRGGSEFTVSSPADPSQQIAIDTITAISPTEEIRVSTVGGTSLRIQTAELTAEQVEEVRAALAEAYDVELADVASAFIGPTWGKDVSGKAIQGVIVFLVLVTVVM